MKRFATAALAASLSIIAGCGPSTGASSEGGLSGGVSASTAPYAVLDIASGAVTYRASLPDAASNPAYRFDQMAFRRVGPDGAKCFIGVFEVSQAQWAALSGASPSTPWLGVSTAVVQATAQSNVHPAYNVSYDDLATLTAAYAPSGRARVAIPTATQWQYAVGSASGYSWGGSGGGAELSAQAVVRETVIYATNASTRLSSGLIDSGGPLPVGSRQPSSQGLYDIHGNVWEWTAPGDEVRGGSWHDAASLARAEVRAGAGQGLAGDVDHALIGARLVLIP